MTTDKLSAKAVLGKILLIEDEEDFAHAIGLMLRRAGYTLEWASTMTQAAKLLDDQVWDLVLLDLTLPDAQGSETITSVQKHQPECPVVVLTGHNDAEFAVQSLRLGAANYLTKPVRRRDLLSALEDSLEQRRISARVGQINMGNGRVRVLGESAAWRESLEMIHAAAAASRTTVLLTGEPGVGKEVGARLIHESSVERDRPFVAVNVACLPDTLVESELFGHEPGAFTGARGTKRGLFEMADGGTLFLDEIGELPMPLQAKMLRVLEGHPFRRLGGEREISPTFRLVSATNRSLSDLVAQGGFRADLYHRLRVLEIKLPPLRQRGPDKEKLALYFLARLGAEMGYERPTISPDALQAIEHYAWPGNVRELRNVMERALVLSRNGFVVLKHLPSELREPEGAGGQSSPEDWVEGEWSLDAAIARHLELVMGRCEGNISQASQVLQITRQTLRRRLRKYGIYEEA